MEEWTDSGIYIKYFINNPLIHFQSSYLHYSIHYDMDYLKKGVGLNLLQFYALVTGDLFIGIERNLILSIKLDLCHLNSFCCGQKTILAN